MRDADEVGRVDPDQHHPRTEGARVFVAAEVEAGRTRLVGVVVDVVARHLVVRARGVVERPRVAVLQVLGDALVAHHVAVLVDGQALLLDEAVERLHRTLARVREQPLHELDERVDGIAGRGVLEQPVAQGLGHFVLGVREPGHLVVDDLEPAGGPALDVLVAVEDGADFVFRRLGLDRLDRELVARAVGEDGLRGAVVEREVDDGLADEIIHGVLSLLVYFSVIVSASAIRRQRKNRTGGRIFVLPPGCPFTEGARAASRSRTSCACWVPAGFRLRSGLRSGPASSGWRSSSCRRGRCPG